jgi:hypothetical protein
MTVIKRARKAQSHTATGKASAMSGAANEGYPAWLRDLVELPTRRRTRTALTGQPVFPEAPTLSDPEAALRYRRWSVVCSLRGHAGASAGVAW